MRSFKVVSQLPWGRTLNAQPRCPHHVITPFGGEGASGLIRWRFVSVDWNWNLPNHSLVFSVRVILVHVKPQPGFCLEPVTLWLLPPLELSLVFACCTGQRPAARLSGAGARRVSGWSCRVPLRLRCAESRVRTMISFCPESWGGERGDMGFQRGWVACPRSQSCLAMGCDTELASTSVLLQSPRGSSLCPSVGRPL